ncbi:MAG: hypothetical protein JSV90_05800 [Methanobacteriota archaeon]|nr:MAG: hypothetical protein JSV90_05800 [Euryarchaeota archaeon]
MRKGRIVTAVGTVIASIGLLILVFAILPAEDTTDFTIPSGGYYYGIYYSGLIGGSIDMDYVAAEGDIRVYVFDQQGYDSYVSTGHKDDLFTTSGDSGSFSFALPDSGRYYFVFEHGSLSESLNQDVTVTAKINGIAMTGMVLGVVLIVVGVVVAVLGGRMKAREAADEPASPAPTDVTFFQGQQQKPPDNS